VTGDVRTLTLATVFFSSRYVVGHEVMTLTSFTAARTLTTSSISAIWVAAFDWRVVDGLFRSGDVVSTSQIRLK
jgi:hypothetical protein